MVVAAIPRFYALGFGDGLIEGRPDEMGVSLALDGMRRGEPFPMFYAYGGGYHTPLYAFVSLWERLFWSQDLTTQIAHDPHRVFVAARFWSAILSTCTVLVTFVIGRRVGGVATGLLAAAILASSPLAIREAHFAKADAAAGFVAALAFLALTVRSPSLLRRALTIGVAAGLALSTKYLMGFALVLIVALAQDLGWQLRGGRWRHAATAIAVMLLVCCALAPSWLTSPQRSLVYMRAVAASQQAFPRQEFFAGWLRGPIEYHTTLSLRYGAGLLVALLTLPAVAYGLRRPGPTRWIALAILVHWVVLTTNPLVVARNLLPSLSGTAVLVAELLRRSALRLPFTRRRLAATLTLVGALIVVEPLLGGIRLVQLLGRTDTRTLAAQWITANVPEGARVATWGAPAGAAEFGLPPLGGRSAARGLPPDQWRARGVTYVVWHSYPLPYSDQPLPGDVPHMNRVAVFDPFDGPLRDPALEPADAFYLPLARFQGIARPGPRIEIFELDRDPM